MKIAIFWDVLTGGLVLGTNIFEEHVVSIFQLEECPENGVSTMYEITQNHIVGCCKMLSELDFKLMFLLWEPLL
jgi:hypothetical protein